MTEPRLSAQPDLERYAPDLLQIDALHAAAGRPALGAVPHPLIYYASSKAVIKLLDVSLQVGRAPRQPRCEAERARLCSALDAFEEIVEAIRGYDVARHFQPRPSSEGRNALRRVANSPKPKSLESLLAREDLRSEYLTALWRAAVKLGKLREIAGVVEVIIQETWHRAGDEMDDWLWKLAADSASLEAVARRAEKEFRARRFDVLRLFRDLKRSRDGTKFLALMAKPPGPSGEPVPLLMAWRAARELDVFGGEPAADWAQQIARDPDLIAELANRVSRRFRGSTGRVHDEALDAYGRALCAIYERLAGQPVTYGTRMNSKAKPPQAERTGLGLTFVRAGLKLIDPETTVDQARRHIDRYKRWRG
jgi:hypothetical protein